MSTSPPKAASPEKSLFTEKEERVLKAAWLCLKSPPDIDLEKLRVAADFNTTKTASNTWGTIKKKLASLAPPVVEGDAGDETATTAAAPKPKGKAKGTAASKKRGKKAVAGDDNEAEAPAKKRKTTKKIVAAGGDDDEEVVKEEPAGEDA
ncbi:hypothetical protein Q7P36_000632 [Cladosporium allicinum]